MQIPAANPYRKPAAHVDDANVEEFSQVKILSASGRLGRIRYIGYSIGMTLVFYLFIALGAAVSAGTGVGVLGAAIIFAAVVGMLVVGVMLTIQRCHDFDVSGWLSLLLVVPVAPLLFWIIPGTKGANRFGAPTPPNSGGVVALALILPLVFVVGILAAVALPAYQKYTERARMTQQIQKQSQAEQAPLEEADAGEAADEASSDAAAAVQAEQPGESGQ
jgi:uncharacterized membrane protein YhaH (DUF805 family)